MDNNQKLPGKDQVFVLDIGTRSIIGIVGYRQEHQFHVEACSMAEHPRRAMIDGQIEDIPQVAKIASQVKADLEKQLGAPLHSVGVAAAGRALRTCRGAFSMELSSTPITNRMIYELENGAVNEARRLLDSGEDTVQYTCVGHSVVKYELDGYPFLTILDHRGSKAEAEVIATFLPTEVVNSLRRCMEMLDLEVDTLTLEPIAAMRAVIPADLRLLNLALVDIGAGTSDIAITSEGSIAGYTMATMAGDEITEAIIKRHLVDFPTAERIKSSLTTEKEVSFKDILGFEHTLPCPDILAEIDVSVEMLAKVITDKIIESNKGSPAAVFLVGGGSKTPGLAARIAHMLGLDSNKVALAGTNFNGNLLTENSNISGPEYATPLGIALTMMDETGTHGAHVTINEKRVRLFTTQATSVMDALLTGGYVYSDLMGRNGRSRTFTLNGTRKVVRGEHYSVAEITLNGQPANLSYPVEDGDCIQITPAVLGKDAAPVVADFAQGALPFTVTLNGNIQQAGMQAFLNGTPASLENPIQEQDELEVSLIQTVADLCLSVGISPDNTPILLNGKSCTPDTLLNPNDTVQVQGQISHLNQVAAPYVPVLEEKIPAATSTPIPIPANARTQDTVDITNENPAPEIHTNDQMQNNHFSAILPNDPVKNQKQPEDNIGAIPELERVLSVPSSNSSLRISLNGRTVVLPPKPGGEPHHLLDMLPLVDIDPAHPKGTVLVKINGKEAGYLDVLHTDDTVEIGWDETHFAQ